MNTIEAVIERIKQHVDEILEGTSVVVYNSKDFEKMPQGDSRLVDDAGFVSIMYAGMASNKSASGGRSTLGRFVILVSFSEDKMRLQGMADPIDMIQFMRKVRTALAGKRAPNNQNFTFVSELPVDFESRGDGYSQQWTVPLTVES
ncbi:tail-completion protein [Vibrio phage vB_VpS_PG28]|nr:tail-completion protein [Vibrio phage vB_VpS_PG28]